MNSNADRSGETRPPSVREIDLVTYDLRKRRLQFFAGDREVYLLENPVIPPSMALVSVRNYAEMIAAFREKTTGRPRISEGLYACTIR
jgi:hypothetical protein